MPRLSQFVGRPDAAFGKDKVMFYAVDRFEEFLAVLQDDEGHNISIDRAALPAGTKQGDVFVRAGDRYLPAPDETERRRNEIQQLQDKLLKRNGRGHP